ncbi:hypothetical protein Pcinc_044159 [Petrolisthes cinctipes]|uniref:Neurotransmitter-gated ion-channel transmembrane domain-containing protein n=1 Tax=Petrolisthes cinctipes TaxID=88211 RepID=A0AAE1EEI4_PETCI|nr:hypothetical protein Pcinc_044159 [Petrolisthes cinctipes]
MNGLGVAVVCVPCESGERVTLGCCVLLCLSLLLTTLQDLLLHPSSVCTAGGAWGWWGLLRASPSCHCPCTIEEDSLYLVPSTPSSSAACLASSSSTSTLHLTTPIPLTTKGWKRRGGGGGRGRSRPSSPTPPSPTPTSTPTHHATAGPALSEVEMQMVEAVEQVRMTLEKMEARLTQQEVTEVTRRQWHQVALVVDRLLFIGFLLASATAAITILLCVVVSPHSDL